MYQKMLSCSNNSLFINILSKIVKKKNRENATLTLLWTRNTVMAFNCSRVLFQPINYNLVTAR